MDAVGKLAVEVVFEIEELDRVRVGFGQLSPLKTFLDLRKPVASAAEVSGEYQDYNCFDPAFVHEAGDVVAEENAEHVIFVVEWVVGIVAVDSTGDKFAIDP